MNPPLSTLKGNTFLLSQWKMVLFSSHLAKYPKKMNLIIKALFRFDWCRQSEHHILMFVKNHRYVLFSLTVGHLWTEPGEEESMFMEIENQTGKFRYGSWNSQNQVRKNSVYTFWTLIIEMGKCWCRFTSTSTQKICEIKLYTWTSG